MLALVGHAETDRVVVCHQPVGGKFIATSLKGIAAAVAHAGHLQVDADVWFGVNSLRADVLPGHKGTEAQVADLVALWADLDVGIGKCHDDATARVIIDALSDVLGTAPTAVVFSGHGWQPYWRLSDDPGEEFGSEQAMALIRGWGNLVAKIAGDHGAKVDGVYHLDRVMRVPGTLNCKEPDDRVKTFARSCGGQPITVTDVQGVLDAHNIAEPNANGEGTSTGHALTSQSEERRDGEPFSRGRLIARVAKAPNGKRNNTLFGAAKDAVKQSDWDTDMKAALTDAARKAGLPSHEIANTLASATKGVACKPFFPDPDTFKLFLKNLKKMTAPQQITANRPELYDAKISEYVASRYLSTFCHSGPFGWMHWAGKRWCSVGEPLVTEAVRLGVLAFHREETNLFQNGTITADRLNATTKLLSANKIAAIVRLAKGYLSVADERWDAHPDLLNCANGVIDLRTATLRDHDPALMLTKLCPTEYRPGATHPDWDSALEAVPEDARTWLGARLGQGLTGYTTPDDVLVLLKGDGENGKSTVVGGLLAAVGSDYAITLPERVLLARPSDHPTELMTLRGTRLALMEELPELGHLNVKRLKIVCGTPRLTARYCGQDSMEWDATHSVFVTTNYFPRVDESDHGTWRRLRALDFPYRYRKPCEGIESPLDKTGDPGLRQRLRDGQDKQHEAILAWLIDGAMASYQNWRVLPAEPASVTACTAEWRGRADHILKFLSEEIVFDPGCYMAATDVYSLFEHWTKDQGHVVWSDQTFAARFAAHERVKSAGIEKQIVRSTRRGQTLVRPRHTDSALPKQFHAWLSVRPRHGEDDFDTWVEKRR
ncbi:DNA primase family protein [Mycolicibacterium hodleri]|uniref:SF3 helicase domain-containing protein n=1 Tax=Mycolicibacterium hodleri TaxID=49897 RepID=A0A502DL39_9MYCO|nr:phage/plasmid primase, P4 family [Mycolicibacterium hodleri]TPG26177.1 hypothetical protein EAH80_29350 [Mycolicibacterium hodleri]